MPDTSTNDPWPWLDALPPLEPRLPGIALVYRERQERRRKEFKEWIESLRKDGH
jgi:hypothetical protein